MLQKKKKVILKVFIKKRERFEDVILLVLKIEEGAVSQRM